MRRRFGGFCRSGWEMRGRPRRRWHERGVSGSRAGIARCSRGRCSSPKRSVARRSRRGDGGDTHQAAIVHSFKETTDYGSYEKKLLKRMREVVKRKKLVDRLLANTTNLLSAI